MPVRHHFGLFDFNTTPPSVLVHELGGVDDVGATAATPTLAFLSSDHRKPETDDEPLRGTYWLPSGERVTDRCAVPDSWHRALSLLEAGEGKILVRHRVYADAVHVGAWGHMVAIRGDKIVHTPLTEVVGRTRPVDLSLFENVAEVFFA